ncbi:hypothetical protein EK21DRAFT_99078 [Setomelanomma holmii]|uniref:AA1-like domain-containing protein n=1 Tax=Setomelanomma holmii TaxID=210430 RepID=A0A9P4HCM1_9PLEO|nr:hypothetical protein EK21DRAFT_99078 [Setomelanomma holmii]
MLFTVASFLAATALAAPAPQTTDCPNPAHCGGSAPDPATYENIDISDYFLRKNDGIQSVSFKLSGNNHTDLSCSIGATTLPSNVTTCGDSDYRFGLIEPLTNGSDVSFRIYHQTAPFAGKWGTGSVPTYCHAGGNGPDDFVCQQVSAVTVVITATG